MFYYIGMVRVSFIDVLGTTTLLWSLGWLLFRCEWSFGHGNSPLVNRGAPLWFESGGAAAAVGAPHMPLPTFPWP